MKRLFAALRESVLADIVAKVFLGWLSKFPGTADAFRMRRCEGPNCFAQK